MGQRIELDVFSVKDHEVFSFVPRLPPSSAGSLQKRPHDPYLVVRTIEAAHL